APGLLSTRTLAKDKSSRLAIGPWFFDESAEVILEGIDAACAFRHVEDSGTFGIFWALVGFATERGGYWRSFDPWHTTTWHTTTAVTYYWHYIYQLSTCSLPFCIVQVTEMRI
ncbi:hypothetical protein E4U28_001665, partial [Claviceps purpurea]